MKRLVLSMSVVAWLSACGGNGPSTANFAPHGSPSGHGGATPAAAITPTPPPDPWVASEVKRLDEKLLTIQTPFRSAWNELTIEPASPGKSSVDFFFEAPTEGTLRIQDFQIEGHDCTQQNAVETAFQLVSALDRVEIKNGQDLHLDPRAYRVRLGLNNVGACQGIKVRFHAPWEGPHIMDAVDNYHIPPAPALREPLTNEDFADPMLKPIENTDQGSLGACFRNEIEHQAPADGKDILLFEGQALRDNDDPSIVTYPYFTRQSGPNSPHRKFQLRLSTSDGQAWRFIYDGFKATAYASGLSLKAHVKELAPGNLNFDVDLSSCKNLIPQMDTSGR